MYIWASCACSSDTRRGHQIPRTGVTDFELLWGYWETIRVLYKRASAFNYGTISLALNSLTFRNN